MPLTPGTKLAQYEVVEAIGAGGMGEVYRARDTKLGRDVAIKVLPEEFARDKERLDRFEREARLLAQLNHTNIAILHGLEEHDGQKFIVMELVEGETLAERIAGGPIPIDEAVPLFIQIAEGLEAAHEKAIIHRDLKPANIQIGPDGKPKILDFGLAKVFAPQNDVSAATSQSPTLTKGTALGAIMGTASYMSPEQARGKEVDKRTDIWAYGCCFYETLTAKQAFTGDSVTDILAAVIGGEPELGSLPREATPEIRKLLRRCLSKGVRERLRDIGEARVALTESQEAPADVHEDAESRRRSRAGIASALFFALAAGAWLGMNVLPSSSSDDVERRRVSRSTLRLPPDQRIPGNVLSPLAISPEGERIAYVALRGGEHRLFIRELDSFESTELDGTEDAQAPFFSPDGRWVGFFARRTLFKVAVGGGSPVAIAAAPLPIGASWGLNDEIIFAAAQAGLQRVSANGGEPSQLTTPLAERGRGHGFPQHLPGGKSVLFTIIGPQLEAAIANLATGEWHPILTGIKHQQYIRGHLLFWRPGHSAVMASTFDPVTSASGQNHVGILEGVRLDHGTNHFSLSASRTGSLVYVPSAQTSVGLVWVDRQGQSRPLEGNLLAKPSSISVSPNGQYAAVREGETIWIVDLERGTGTIVVGKSLDEGRFQTPIWTTDGSRITFSCDNSTSSDWDLCSAPPGGGETELLLARAGAQVPHSWSPNGELLFGETRGSGADILVMLPGGEISPVIATEANEATAEFSPDGRWIVYGSDETGRDEIYVRSYPEGTTFQRVSEQGGVAPRWSGDGNELFYRSGIRMMAVTIETEQELKLGIPQVLFEEPFEQNPFVTLDEQPNYDVVPEGDRFLMVADRSAGEIELILNWDRELERLVPPND